LISVGVALADAAWQSCLHEQQKLWPNVEMRFCGASSLWGGCIMFTAYIIVTVLTAAANTFAAIVDFRRPQWVLDNIAKWGGSHSWLVPLGALKGAGALGLLVGIGVPLIGIAAAVGLALFFVGAITVVILARWYSHLRWPVTYLLLAVASLALRLTVS
jgi:DoxX-like protein